MAIDGLFVIEPDPDARADHFDVEGVPLAYGVVGFDEGPFAGVVGVVVPECAGAFVCAVFDFAGVVGVPDLDLGIAAEVDSGIAVVFDHEPIDVEFEIAVVFVGGEVYAMAVGDDFAFGGVYAPVFIAIGIPFGLGFGLFFLGEFCFFVGAVGSFASAPACEVFAVEEIGEAVGGFVEGFIVGLDG